MTDKPLTEAERRVALPPGAYPFASHYAAIDGASLHFADEGSGPAGRDDSWQPDLERALSELHRGGMRGQHRCVAVDLAGFGLSVPPPDFSFRPEDHARLIAGLLDRLDLKDAALVAHDWGGPVGLCAAMMTSSRISSLCLGNTWAWPVNGDFHFEWFSKLMGGPIGRFGSERYATFVNLVMPSAMRRRKLSAQELDLYRAPFVKLQSRRGMHVFPWEITAIRDYSRGSGISSPSSAGRPISSGRKTTSPCDKELARWRQPPAPGRGAAGREMRPLPLDRRARRVPRRGARISRREPRLIGAERSNTAQPTACITFFRLTALVRA